MKLTLDQALKKGIEAHKAGQVQEADRYYTAILKADPKHSDANHNMGILAVGIGKTEEALQFFKSALEANPSISQFWLSYIDALIKLDRIADAKSLLKKAISRGAKGDGFDQVEQSLAELENTSEMNTSSKKSQEPPDDQLQGLLKLYSQGQCQQALTKGSKLLKKFPRSINLYNIIGAASNTLGKLNEAIEAYGRALSIKPDYAEAYNNMGNALKAQGKLVEAIEAYNKAFSIKPDYADAYNNMGNILKTQGKLDEALEAYDKATSIKPDYAEAYNNMGNALQQQGKLDEAVEVYTKALSKKFDYADAYNNIGNALQQQGKLDEAIEAFTKALSLKPDYAEAYNNMAVVLMEQGKLEEALEAYNKAISIKPDFAEAHNNVGLVLQDHGKLEEALEAYNKAISIKPGYAEAHRNLSSVKEYNTTDKHFLQVRDYYDKKDLSADAKCHFSFALAKMYDDMGNMDRSFAFLTTGNLLRKQLLEYSIDKDKCLFKELKKTQPNLLANALDIKENSTNPTPVFILGMPRSGTTLVEQIISSHSKVTGAGELNHVSHFGEHLALDPAPINTAAISEFRNNYSLELSKLSNGKQFVTDKMPQNFRFIPLICAAFPEAKIIHVQRNAYATCWSNYKQYFKSNGLGYCYDLKDIISYYELYKDLMNLWQSHYGGRIYNLNYEILTTDQKNQTQKLIKYLNLTWEEACLSPHQNKRSIRTASQQQVRKKVYQGSSEAWLKYEPYLNGAFDRLKST